VLDPGQVELDSLCEALEDHSDEAHWWIDPRTGHVGVEGVDQDDPAPEGALFIDPLPSRESYRDLEDFIGRVRHPRAREMLTRAIAGRGAFRRFKDTLFEFPDLREAWFRFHDTRMERRGLEWLADARLVERDAAEKGMEARPDPLLEELAGPLDPAMVARQVSEDLHDLYASRLRKVVLCSKGDHGDDDVIDLCVIVDEADPWAEGERIDGILWRHSYENDVVVRAIVMGDSAATVSSAVYRARVAELGEVVR